MGNDMQPSEFKICPEQNNFNGIDNQVKHAGTQGSTVQNFLSNIV